MSLFGALDTAVSGLGAQSAAFSNIGDNVANSQTIGFKGTDTRFSDYLTSSTAADNESGSVVATPSYQNDVQGTITQSSNPLAMAISGQGFFAVSQNLGTGSNGLPVFSSQTEYTRAGDFQLDKNGYIVNGAGQYLNAWSVNAAGNVNQTQLAPIQVPEASLTPTATSQLTLSANLPATPSTTPTAASPLTSQVSVYDATGTQQQLTLNWSQVTNGPTLRWSRRDSGASRSTDPATRTSAPTR
jgi:flagellar hook protein FlgE